jgi:hypothetical protein
VNETEFRQLAHRAAAEVDTAAPTAAVLEQARAVRRRRRAGRYAVLAGVAASLLSAGMVVGLDRWTGAETDPDPAPGPGPTTVTPSEPPTTDGDPIKDFAAPEGMRWVGAKDVVVAVPQEWGTNQLHCNGSASAPTVAFPSGDRDELCGAIFEEHLRLDIRSGPSFEVPLACSPQLCTEYPLGGGESAWSLDFISSHSQLVVPSRGVTFTLWPSGEPYPVKEIFSTVRLVPQGWTTLPDMPQDSVARSLMNAGFTVRFAEAPHPSLRPGAFLGTEPPIGTPVREGSTVTTVYAAGNFNAVVPAESLADAGWQVRLLDDYADIAVTRDEAKEAALSRPAPKDPHDDLAFSNADTYLRSLFWPPCNNNGCDHQVWRPVYLVVTDSDFTGDRFRNELVVIDARTGEVLTRGDFLGRP